MSLPDKIFQPERYTYNDYKLWEGRWELINGFPVAMSPSANRKHQGFITKFLHQVHDALEASSLKCDCYVYPDLDWIINEDTIVRPDAMIVCGEFTTDFLTFPPTLIIEVTSTSTRMRDRNTKFTLYEMNGVKYYLIADSDKKDIEIYQLVNNKYQQNTTTLFQLGVECTIRIDHAILWK
jgi:Uma2 family endonuclease